MVQLRVAQNQVRLPSIDQTAEDGDIQSIQTLVYEPLVRWDRGRMVPGLADSWRVADGGRTWYFHLREDANFTDGSPCTVEDVLHTFEVLRVSFDPFNMPGPYVFYLQSLVVVPVNRYEFKIHTLEPNGDVADIVSEIYIRKADASGRPVLGTGRYAVVDYENDQFVHLRLRKDVSQAAFNEVYFEQISGCQERYEALKADRVDLAINLEEITEQPDKINYRWGKVGNTMSVVAFLNGFTEPFNQLEARRAINMAIDINRLIRDVWPGLAIPSATVVSPFHYGYPEGLAPITYDPNAANEIFSKIGMPSELVLRTPTFLPDRSIQVCQHLSAQLDRWGVKVRIDVVEDRFDYARQVGARQIGHMAMFDSTPHSTYRILREKVSSHHKWMWWQGVVDEQANNLINVAHEAYQPDLRQKAYERVLTHLNQCPVWLYLYNPITVFAYKKCFQGIEMGHTGLLRI